MAEYLLSIYRDETRADPVGTEVSESYRAFMERYANVLRGGAALDEAATATSVRHDRTGSVAITDGVFVESKEVLGGYYVIEVADLDEALAVARDVPAPGGGVEVRPIKLRS